MIPNIGETKNLQKILNQNITLKLFSNDVTPGETDTVGTYVEVVGGGYVAKTLTFANWAIVAGSPSIASYAAQDFNFTGPTTGPTGVYGYYLVDSDGDLMGSERFPPSVVPFTPVLGSLVRVTPKYGAE